MASRTLFVGGRLDRAAIIGLVIALPVGICIGNAPVHRRRLPGLPRGADGNLAKREA